MQWDKMWKKNLRSVSTFVRNYIYSFVFCGFEQFQNNKQTNKQKN